MCVCVSTYKHICIHTYIRKQFWKLNELDKGISMCGEIYAFDGTKKVP